MLMYDGCSLTMCQIGVESPYLLGVDSLSVSKRGEVADMDRTRLVCHGRRPGIDAQSVGSGTGFPFEKMVGRDILGRGIRGPW